MDDHHRQFIEGVRTRAFVERLEAELGLPVQWSTFIVAEDDWSFVIKCHALLEAAANRTLILSIGRPELRDFVTRLEMSGQASGKVAVLVSLGILNSDCKRFLSKLSELRNAFVHDVRNTTRTISSFLESLEPSERKGFETAFCWKVRDWHRRDVRTIAGGIEDESLFYVCAASSWDQGVLTMSLWFGVLLVLRKLHLAHASNETKERDTALLQEARSIVRELRNEKGSSNPAAEPGGSAAG
jgi:hypothetical protein